MGISQTGVDNRPTQDLLKLVKMDNLFVVKLGDMTEEDQSRISYNVRLKL